jgi:hypothetical protein
MLDLIYFVNAADHAIYRSAYPSAKAVFVAFGTLTKKQISACEERVCAWDEFISEADATFTHAWLYELLSNWYRIGDSDVSEFSGVSLGRTAHFVLSGLLSELMRVVLSGCSFVERLRPSRIIAIGLPEWWARSVKCVAQINNIPYIQMGPERLDLDATCFRYECARSYSEYFLKKKDNIKSKLWRHACKLVALLHGGLKYSKGGVQDVLVLGDPGLNEIWYEWITNRCYRSSIRLGFIPEDPPLKKLAIYGLLRGCRYYRSRRISTDAFCMDAKGKMLSLIRSPSWLERFAWREHNLGEMLIPVFEWMINTYMPTLATKVVQIEDQLRMSPPQAVVLPHLELPDAQIIHQLRNKFGYRVILAFHGLLLTYENKANLFMLPFDADMIIAGSGMQAQNYINSGADPASVAAIGFPVAERTLRFYTSNHSQPKKGSVLVLDYAMSYGVLSHKATFGEEYFRRIVQILIESGYSEIVYKLHPGRHHLEYYKALCKHYGYEGSVSVVKDHDILELMAQAEIIVGPVSTAIIEAAILDRPYICAHIEPIKLWPPLDSGEVPVAHSYEELQRFVRNYPSFWKPMRSALLRDVCGWEDGEMRKEAVFGRQFLAWLESFLEKKKECLN